MAALQHSVIPDRAVTVFAGIDRDAVERARAHMAGYPPSSPAMGLFKNGEQVFMLQRRDIEQMSAAHVAEALTQAFEKHGGKAGPSIDPEEFEKITNYQGCGSSIPVINQP